MGKPAQLPRSLTKLQSQLRHAQAKASIDLLVIPSQDIYLSEYTPSHDSPRFLATGFSGSTGLAIGLSDKARKQFETTASAVLFVDGRYHLQADQECSPHEVLVEKLDLQTGVFDSLLKYIEARLDKTNGLTLGFDPRRSSYLHSLALDEFSSRTKLPLLSIDENFWASALLALPLQAKTEIQWLKQEHTGRSPEELNKTLFGANNETLGLMSATDDLAFLLNARSFDIPFHSSIMGYALCANGEIHAFLPEPQLARLNPHQTVQIHSLNDTEITSVLTSLSRHTNVTSICFNAGSTVAKLVQIAQEIFPHAVINGSFRKLITTRAAKTNEELDIQKNNFKLASLAISETLRELKSNLRSGKRETEFSAAKLIESNYKKHGATALSFNTISGAGANSAIVHYGTNSDQVELENGSLFLLDSGAYFDAGFCTDCTRVIYCGTGLPEPWQIETYTLVVKAWIRGFLAATPLGDSTKDIDQQMRSVLIEKGFNYKHGTGHGVGILVHEAGAGIGQSELTRALPNHVTSVEPGLYHEGRGGVRIEDVAYFKTSSSNVNSLVLESMIRIGLDWELIDLNLINQDEKKFLSAYENDCLKWGTQVTPCPL